jgi:hypothetical protein
MNRIIKYYVSDLGSVTADRFSTLYNSSICNQYIMDASVRTLRRRSEKYLSMKDIDIRAEDFRSSSPSS